MPLWNLCHQKDAIWVVQCDELKSHPFSVPFLIYFYLKRLIYVQKYGITNQTIMQQGIQEKEEFLQKKGQKVDEHH